MDVAILVQQSGHAILELLDEELVHNGKVQTISMTLCWCHPLIFDFDDFRVVL